MVYMCVIYMEVNHTHKNNVKILVLAFISLIMNPA